jgi:hypothetical protein
MESRPAAIRLLVPGNIRHNSGGNVYNASLADAITRLGVRVDVEPVDGIWPVGSSEERRRLAGLLKPGTVTPDQGTVTIVDGLVASGAPEALETAAEGERPWVLLHMPLLDHPDLEIRALGAAAGVICTSGSAAAEITRRHGLTQVHVALPGTNQADLAEGSEPPHLISVAALLPNKDQLILLGALAQVTDLPHGVPVVVRTGTGAVEALKLGAPGGDESLLPGAAVVLDRDPRPLAATLRAWLTTPELQAEWRQGALAGRELLPGWDSTARWVLDIIGGCTPRG